MAIRHQNYRSRLGRSPLMPPASGWNDPEVASLRLGTVLIGELEHPRPVAERRIWEVLWACPRERLRPRHSFYPFSSSCQLSATAEESRTAAASSRESAWAVVPQCGGGASYGPDSVKGGAVGGG
uniref:LD25304p n=1 Tax=Drosophila melanogaster TaxID=7227 RepID=Q95TE1_DROME|nr:LD25304p [Drosophila melanogaster]